MQNRKMTIDRTVNVCVLCTDEGLISHLQMYSTGVYYVLFKVQGFLLFVTYTIIQGIISSEM